MTFYEVQFPTEIGLGFRGGPGFSTSIIVTDSGAEQRVARWGTGRRRYNASRGLTQAESYGVLEHYIAMTGPADGFRFKDWTDYATTATGTAYLPLDAAVLNTDVEIGTGDGTTTTFQLIKKYTSGPSTRTRNITKPVSGTVVIAFDGVNQASGWTVNTTSGVVMFSPAPTIGVSITAGFEFDVPVRFGAEVDEDGLQAAVENFDHVEVPDIPIDEIRDVGATANQRYPGGAINHGVITADMAITRGQGLVHTTEQTATGLALVMPNADTVVGGGPYFVADNQGSTTLNVDTTAGTTAIAVTAGNNSELWIKVASDGTRSWVALG